MLRASQLKIHGIGVVAANKPLDSDIIEVTSVEDSPMLDGEINSDINKETIKSEDSQGGQYNVTLNSANSVKAQWLRLGYGNRKTPPDVRRGAQVVLWKFADSKKLYWMTLMEDLQLRKLETVVWAFSATKNEDDPVDDNNYYYLEISTHKKLIHFHTTKRNDEPFSYDIQINTGDGFIKFQDDVGNWIILDSKEKQIAMHNVDGCYFDLNKKNLTVNVPETYTIKANNIVEEVGQSITTKAGSSISSQTSNHTTKASTLTEQAGTINITGSSAVTITGAPVSIN